MKLFKATNNETFLTKNQWKKVCLATSFIVIIIYIIAMTFSLCGSKYFILDYQNEWMNSIENKLNEWKIYPMFTWFLSTIEFTILLSFVLNKKAKWYYIVAFYVPVVILLFFIPLPQIFFTLYPFLFYFVSPLIEEKRNLTSKKYLRYLLKILIAVAVSFIFQLMIYIIKSGEFTLENQKMNLSANVIYSLEYDIALFIVLLTISLFLNKEEGEEQLCTTPQHHGGFSQISKKQLQTSKWKTLKKKTKQKIILFYVKLYTIQLGGFTLLMVIPFLFGKVFEFLIMYLSFAIIRYILGFKYSLHYKNEILCISVGVITFGLLTLIVPHVIVDIIAAILFGICLAIILHLSYKYKAMNLFISKVSKDRFAEIYVIFDGNLNEDYIKKMSNHYLLTDIEINILIDFCNGFSLSELSKKYAYSQIYINKLLDKIIEKLQQRQ